MPGIDFVNNASEDRIIRPRKGSNLAPVAPNSAGWINGRNSTYINIYVTTWTNQVPVYINELRLLMGANQVYEPLRASGVSLKNYQD